MFPSASHRLLGAGVIDGVGTAVTLEETSGADDDLDVTAPSITDTAGSTTWTGADT